MAPRLGCGQALTNPIRWVRAGFHLAGREEPDLEALTATLLDPKALERLVADAGAGVKDPDDAHTAAEVERWHRALTGSGSTLVSGRASQPISRSPSAAV